MSRGSYRIVIPCSEWRPERRHRWRLRATHHVMPDGQPVMDEWCQNCGVWFIDAIEHPAAPSRSSR